MNLSRNTAVANIERYVSEDKDALVQFWQTVFPDEPAHNAPKQMLEDKLQVDDLIFIAKEGRADGAAQIVGACMVGYDGHRGWLYAVGVSPASRRQGIGQQLITHSIDALRQLGCRKLNLQIRSDNTAVADFYKSLGFAVEERVSMGLRI